MEDGHCVIGIDLGGTKVEGAVVDGGGAIRQRLCVPTDVKGGAEAIADQIGAMVKELAGQAPSPINGVGVGVPGQIDPAGERVVFAPNLNWNDVSLKHDLAQRMPFPLHLDNDVRVATLGEWRFGAGKGIDNFICLFLGTGVGGGVVINGQLLKGSSNTAGELGHMVVQIDGPPCTCHNRGCLEAFAGGWAIARNARELVKDRPEEASLFLELTKGDITAITGQVVAEAYQKGDGIAKEVVQAASEALVAWAVSMVNGFNPQRLILGGGLLKGFPNLVEEIDQGVRQKALSAAISQLQVMATALQGNANLLGAAALALQP